MNNDRDSKIIGLPSLLDEKQAAARLDVSIATLRRMVSRGDIGSYKFRRKRRFSERQLREYLEAVECPPKKNAGHMEAFISPAGITRQIGTVVGSTPRQNRRAPPLSALATSKKRSGD